MGKSLTVPGKCYAISDGDRQDDPYIILHIIMVVPYSTNKLYHVKQTAIFQHKLFTCILDCGMNHLCSYRDKCVLTIV